MAALIAVGSLLVSNMLVADLQREERSSMEVWAQAMRSFSNADQNTDLTLVLQVLEGNNTIPVVVVNSSGEVQAARNLPKDADLEAEAGIMRQSGSVIRVDLGNDDWLDVCYAESIMLRRLQQFPYVQLLVMGAFMIVALFALLSAKRAEQNKVWVGLSKETAHQLGTPISSLMAWVEVLRESYPDDPMLPEMATDVRRLQMIAERFSKIGSQPELQPESLDETLRHVAEYMGRRAGNKVKLTLKLPDHPLVALLNAPLFEWVVENLCKNAVDAMEGRGNLTITALEESGCFIVEVADTGKGIPAGHFKDVFSPGFTTKKRGWGLGLSLARRIVEDYHRGRIFVKESRVGVGTTFRIELK